MRFVYPQGKAKALTFSYDDAQHYDRELVPIFNEYGMKATFHLNSGTLDGGIFIQKDEVAELYKGHEIATHGVQHKNPTMLNKHQLVLEFGEDRKELEKLTGYMVQGLSYAFGAYSGDVKEAAKSVGLKYARTVNSTNGFHTPGDFMEWNPTCHHDGGIMDLGKNFLNVPDYIELPLMYVWGHSFEFGLKNDYSVIEEFCKMMQGKEDIWYATNLEICDYLTATRSLEWSADGKIMKNPTAISVWFLDNAGQLCELKSGESKCLG